MHIQSTSSDSVQIDWFTGNNTAECTHSYTQHVITAKLPASVVQGLWQKAEVSLQKLYIMKHVNDDTALKFNA